MTIKEEIEAQKQIEIIKESINSLITQRVIDEAMEEKARRKQPRREKIYE
jgi:hypothetical protein